VVFTSMEVDDVQLVDAHSGPNGVVVGRKAVPFVYVFTGIEAYWAAVRRGPPL
jgi:hypothetical protein